MADIEKFRSLYMTHNESNAAAVPDVMDSRTEWRKAEGHRSRLDLMGAR